MTPNIRFSSSLNFAQRPPRIVRNSIFRRFHARCLLLLSTTILISACDGKKGLAPETLSTPPAAIANKVVAKPDNLLDSAWLQELKNAQLATSDQINVFHDFRFEDRLPDSGIDFVHKIVNDSGKEYVANHYDHGNGVAVADVDQDGLFDIYFTTQLGKNQLWHNLGNGQFEDWTDRAGVAIEDPIGVSASFADIDNDGDPDLFATSTRGGNFLFENDGTGIFRDITASANLKYNGHSSSATFFDFNRDGLLDIFLTNVGNFTTEEIGEGGYYRGHKAAFARHLFPSQAERSILYKNVGNNRFEDVSEKVGLIDKSWSGDAHVADFNEDGWPDLYVINMQGHDEYYENDQGQRFVKKSRQLFPATPWGAMGVGIFDQNNDGHMDVFVTDMHTDMWDKEPFQKYIAEKEKAKVDPAKKMPQKYLATDGNHIWGNALFQNNGDGTFKEISDEAGAENYWPWGLSVGDLNADGFEDVFIASSMNLGFRYAINSLLLNNRGDGFKDSEFILGVEPRRNGRIAIPWFELDCDGSDKAHEICQGREGRVEIWGALGSRSSVLFDYDNDGDLDIITNDFNSEPLVLESDLVERKPIRFLKLQLVGHKSNRDGLGAKVVLQAGDSRFTQVHDGKSGYLAQSSMPLYFGLDQHKVIDKIEIEWPSGTKQTVNGPIETNQMLTIQEDAPGTP